MKSIFWIYVLKSDADGACYIGSTKDIEKRLRRHNQGEYRYTKGHRPWKLIYKEVANSRSEVIKRER